MQRKTLVHVLPAALLTLTIRFASPCACVSARAQNTAMAVTINPSSVVDPSRSAFHALLNRDDVKTELALSQRQSEQMAAEHTAILHQIAEQQKSLADDAQALRALHGEERDAKMKEFMSKVNAASSLSLDTFTRDMNAKAQEVLKPEQMKRLRELDLQYRGPLALSESKLAEKLDLTQEQKTKIAALLTEYQTQRSMALSHSSTSIAPPAPGEAPDFKEANAKISQARTHIDVVRKAQGNKVLALLTDAQKAAWSAAQGVPFKFRAAE